MAKILGISAYYHDAAAAIVINGKVVAAVQEERFTRQKHTEVFPSESIKYCLKETGLAIEELDTIVFYDKPFLKFERLLETYYAYSPKGLLSFLKAIPTWIGEKLFLKKTLLSGLKEIEDFDSKKVEIYFSEHHLSHLASAYYPSGFEELALLTIDGVGEWSTASIGYASKGQIEVLKEMYFPHSVGLLYSAFTYYLGFKVNSGEYKLMGLAPYGNKDSEQVNDYIQKIKSVLVDIKEDGSIWLNQKYFSYASGLKMVPNKKWETLFQLPKRKPEQEFTQNHCDLALAIQIVTEEIVYKMAIEAKRITNSKNLCLAGGVALNCVSNGKLAKSKLFDSIYIQPASGDAGGALGAAYAWNAVNDSSFIKDTSFTPYLGPDFSDKEVLLMAKRFKAVYDLVPSDASLIQQVSELLARGNVIGWFQGRMEFGPRALGNRSILADPSQVDIQQKVNLKIKKREGFRPFAPAVLDEDVSYFFENISSSPYMLLVDELKEELRNDLPQEFENLSMKEKLTYRRSDWQGITHVDFSSRIQTVNESDNPKFWSLLKAFKGLKGKGILINTSFNVRGEPIVCTPEDAYRCFMNTDMDYLVINNFIFDKQKQDTDLDWELKFDKD